MCPQARQRRRWTHRAADPQAVLATRNVRGQLSDANRVQMRAAVCHSFFPLSESARRSALRL